MNRSEMERRAPAISRESNRSESMRLCRERSVLYCMVDAVCCMVSYERTGLYYRF